MCIFTSYEKEKYEVIEYNNTKIKIGYPENIIEAKIKYTKEKTIKIKDRNSRFDFYLDGFSIFIEFDGIQHFIERDYFGGSDYFERIKENDSLKDEWIKINKLKIIRINYKELNKITLDYMRNLIYN